MPLAMSSSVAPGRVLQLGSPPQGITLPPMPVYSFPLGNGNHIGTSAPQARAQALPLDGSHILQSSGFKDALEEPLQTCEAVLFRVPILLTIQTNADKNLVTSLVSLS